MTLRVLRGVSLCIALLAMWPAAGWSAHFAGQLKDGGKVDWMLRVTQLYEKLDGEWWVVHEHVSLPVDAATGSAVYQAAKSTQGGAEYSTLKKE